jgi:hypothetical protein
MYANSVFVHIDESRASPQSHLSVENVVDRNAQPDDGDTRSQPLVTYKYIARTHSRAKSRMLEMVTYSLSFDLLWKLVAKKISREG